MTPHNKGEQDKRDNKYDPPNKWNNFFLASEGRKEQMAKENLEYDKGQRYVEGQEAAEKGGVFSPSWGPSHFNDLTRSDEVKNELKAALHAGWKNGRDNVRTAGKQDETSSDSDASTSADFSCSDNSSSSSSDYSSGGGGGTDGLGIAIMVAIFGAVIGAIGAVVVPGTAYFMINGNSAEADSFSIPLWKPGAIIGAILGFIFVLRDEDSRKLIFKQVLWIIIIFVGLLLLGFILNLSH